MKHLIILFVFLIISLNGFCDTIDYWHVYMNDKLIAKFNANSKDLNVNIKKMELKNSDVITVRYGSDNSCIDCSYGLIILVEIKRKLPEVQSKERFGKLSIPIKDLLNIQKIDGINKFPFNYYERTSKRLNETGRLLFVLTIT